MAETPHQDALKAYHIEKGVITSHVDCGPEAAEMTAEERAAYELQILKAGDAHRASTTPIPVADLISIADALEGIMEAMRVQVSQFVDMSPAEREFRSKVISLLGMSTVLAEQALPPEIRKQRRVARLKPAT